MVYSCLLLQELSLCLSMFHSVPVCMSVCPSSFCHTVLIANLLDTCIQEFAKMTEKFKGGGAKQLGWKMVLRAKPRGCGKERTKVESRGETT